MSATAGVLLGVVVAIQLVCAVGVLVVDDPSDRLHLVGPVSVLATVVAVVAIVLEAGSRTHVAKVVVTGLFLWAGSPFVTRATARALRIRGTGRLVVSDDEIEGGTTP